MKTILQNLITSAKALTLKSIGSSPKGSSKAIEMSSNPIKPETDKNMDAEVCDELQIT